MVGGAHEQKPLWVIQTLVNPHRIAPRHDFIQLSVNQQNSSRPRRGRPNLFGEPRLKPSGKIVRNSSKLLSVRMNFADVERSGPGDGGSNQLRAFISGKKREEPAKARSEKPDSSVRPWLFQSKTNCRLAGRSSLLRQGSAHAWEGCFRTLKNRTAERKSPLCSSPRLWRRTWGFPWRSKDRGSRLSQGPGTSPAGERPPKD